MGDLAARDIIGRLAAKLDGLTFDQIVGIPRGGLIVAAALGYRLDVARVHSFTVSYRRHRDGPPTIGRILSQPVDWAYQRLLLVEDGTGSGTLLEFARHRFTACGPASADVTTASLWVSKDSDYRPDVWVEEVDTLPSGASLLGESLGQTWVVQR